MNNTTTESSLEDPSTEEWKGASTGIYVITILCTTWTICANIVIILCFYRNRRRNWSSFSHQTFSMTVSDLFVGLSFVPGLMVERNDGRMNGILCSSFAFLFFSTQCVTLYHVVGICIYRNIKLQAVSDIGTERHEKIYAFGVIIGSWAFAFIVTIIPFVIWTDFVNEDVLCDAENIFQSNFEQIALYLAISYFSSQSLTNVIYMITCFRLWWVTRKTHRFNNTVQPIPTTSSSADTKSTRPVPLSTLDVQIPKLRESKLMNTPKHTGENWPANTSLSGPSQSTIRSQKRVIVTIGILLLLFNVFTLPISAGLFVDTTQSTSMNRDVRIVVSTLFVINSGINPIVYATRNRTLSAALKSIMYELVQLICRLN